MNRLLSAIVIALCFPLTGWSAEAGIITEEDLPAGGVKTTYLAEFNVANINQYGVMWSFDDKMAVHIYWTDSDVAYINNLSTYSSAWVKARVDGDELWVPNGQVVLVSDRGTVYNLITGVVDMAKNSIEAREGIRFTVNSDRTKLSMESNPDDTHILGFYTMDVAKGSILQAFSNIKLEKFTLETVSPPDDAEYKRFAYSTLLGGYQNWKNGSWIAFDGNDVYVQGLEWIHPKGWVKGSLMNDGSIRIPSGQYVGMNGNYPDFYTAASYQGKITDDSAKIEERSAFVLNYDEKEGSYSMADNECFFCGKDMYIGFPVIEGSFVPFDVKAAEPAIPDGLKWDSEKGLFTFHIPMTDTDGEPVDRYLLSYSVYVNGEKYSFNESNSPIFFSEIDEVAASESYMFFNIETEYMFGWNPGDLYAVSVRSDEPIKSLGVALYYDVLGDKRTSERAEIAVEAGLSATEAGARQPVAFYSLDGRLLREPRGICIVRYSDGSVEKRILIE